MKKIILSILFILSAHCANAAFQIVALVTTTNAPNTNGSSFAINGDVRTGTNAISSMTYATNTSIGGITTNLFRQIIRFKFAGEDYAEWISTNSFKIWMKQGYTMTNVFVGNNFSVTLTTNTIGATKTNVSVPAINAYSQSDATNIFTQLVNDISDYSTVPFRNGRFSGNVSITGGNLVITNAGSAGLVLVDEVTGINFLIRATSDGTFAIQNQAADVYYTLDTNGVNIFYDAAIAGTNIFEVRNQSGSEIYAGISATSAFFPSITNSTFVGTNNWQGDIAYISRVESSQANGNNSGVTLGTNIVIDLSGATTRSTNCGFVAERNGSFHKIFIWGCATNVIANENGNEPSSINRIITGTGGDIQLTNQPAWIDVYYRTNRWFLTGHSN